MTEGEKWTHYRIRQLDQLRELLIEASYLNNGSGVIERMKKVVNLAKALFDSDLKKGRKSFIQFLIDIEQSSAKGG